MSPLIPRSRDQKQLKRKRKAKQKQCITKKKPKTNLFKNRKVQKTVKNPKKTKNCKKHRVTVYVINNNNLTFLFVVILDLFLSFLIERFSVLVVG